MILSWNPQARDRGSCDWVPHRWLSCTNSKSYTKISTSAVQKRGRSVHSPLDELLIWTEFSLRKFLKISPTRISNWPSCLPKTSSQKQWLSVWTTLPLRGHLAMSAFILVIKWKMEAEVLLVAGQWRPGVRLNSLQWQGQPPAPWNQTPQDTSCVEVETPWSERKDSMVQKQWLLNSSIVIFFFLLYFLLLLHLILSTYFTTMNKQRKKTS